MSFCNLLHKLTCEKYVESFPQQYETSQFLHLVDKAGMTEVSTFIIERFNNRILPLQMISSHSWGKTILEISKEIISAQSLTSLERENYYRMKESKDLCQEDIRDHPSSSFHHLFINSVNKSSQISIAQ